jgi:hypothetical protein
MLIPHDQLDQLISTIHATPHMVVIEFAGAGAQALTWLHAVGGSSRTILEATDRYAAPSLIEAIGFSPVQFTSSQVAQAMAVKAFFRASHLVASPQTPVVGLGCTATITTDRLKRGEHRVRVAICDAQGVTTNSVTLTKGLRTRREEEELVSLLIIKALAQACGLTGLPHLPLVEPETLATSRESIDLLARLMAGEVEWVVVWPDGQMSTGQRWPNLALLSGAFNPLHPGHRQLAQVAAKKLGREVYFELPLVNADKAPIFDQDEVRRRMAQFAGFAPVVLTRAPLFSQKAQFFPDSVFILGVDTVERLTQPRFYHNNLAEMRNSFEDVRAAGCRFLVAGRFENDRFITLGNVDIPQGYQGLFEQIPEEEFRVDISSTAMREGRV